jgi:predicted negative regulator of RcsB-dependent stress response
MTDAFWPLAVVVIAVLALVGWLCWLRRETGDQKTARELREEMRSRDADWLERFNALDRKHATLETQIRNLQPDRPNPLGRAYNPRST